MPDLSSSLFELGSYALGIGALYFAFRESRYLALLVVVAMGWGYALEAFNIWATDTYYYNRFHIMIGQYPFWVPLTIAVSWGVVFYTTWMATNALRMPRWRRPFVAALLALVIDLALDPIAAQSKLVPAIHLMCTGNFPAGDAIGVGFWVWCVDPAVDKAFWFGVPLSNYFGWMSTIFGFSLGAHLIDHWLDPERKSLAMKLFGAAAVLLIAVVVTYSLLFIYMMLFSAVGVPEAVTFWSVVALTAGMTVTSLRGVRRHTPLNWIVLLAPAYSYLSTWGLFLFAGVAARSGPVLWLDLLLMPLLGMYLYTRPYDIPLFRRERQ